MMQANQIWEIRENNLGFGKRIFVYDVPCGWIMKGLNDLWIVQMNSKTYTFLDGDAYNDAIKKIDELVKKGEYTT